MPDNFESLKDDPFRSLSAAVLDAGGFAKSDEPFLEFLWANYFRDRMPMKLMADHPKKALSDALALARSEEASLLPGWPGKA
jgi:hypothetical protein